MSDFSSPVNIDQVSSTELHFQRLQKLQERIAGPSPVLSDEQRTEFAKAAKGFESMFVNMMMKQMRESMLEKDKDDEEGDLSFGADTLQGYTDLQFADHVSSSGGIGIAQQVYQYLTHGEKLPVTTQYPGGILPSSESAQKPIPQTSAAAPANNARGNFLDRVADRLQPYDEIIARASERYNVPVPLIKGIITAESAGNPRAHSGAGAKGLMQLMDATAKDLGVRDSYDPEQNIMGGTKYISSMLNMFDNDQRTALAAYNAGPGNVQKHNGIPPFRETQAYVRNVLRYTAQYEETAT